MAEEASNQILLRYAEDTEVKVLVSYLTQEDPSNRIVNKVSFKAMNRILEAAAEYEQSCAKKNSAASYCLPELESVFSCLPHSQRLAALVWLLSRSAYRLANINPNHPSSNRQIESTVRGDWLLQIFRLPSIEPYLRNQEYASIIFQATYALLEGMMDYELHLVIQEDFLQHTYQKLRQVYREYKQRVKEQTNIFKEELMMTVLHPDRIGPMIEKYGLEVMEWGI